MEWWIPAVLFGSAALVLVPILSMYKLLRWQQNQHQEERKAWEAERERLLNRSMTKEWQSYQMMNAQLVNLSSSSEDNGRGMSDEEELRRIGEALAASEGIGETLVDYRNELSELGLAEPER